MHICFEDLKKWRNSAAKFDEKDTDEQGSIGDGKYDVPFDMQKRVQNQSEGYAHIRNLFPLSLLYYFITL